MRKNLKLVGLSLSFGLLFSLPLYLGGCDRILYPTLFDVKVMDEAGRDFQGGLQDATVTTMTEQHTALAPELQAVFATILDQNQDIAGSLRTLAAEKAATVKGPQISGFSLSGAIPTLLSMFGLGSLIPIYNMFFGKSRAANEIKELKLALAVKAEKGQEIPG